MTSSAVPSRTRIHVFLTAAAVGFGLAVLALVLLAAAPLGWRAGWWSYSVSLLTLLPYAGYAALAGGIISLLALIFGRSALGGRGVTMAVIGVLVAAGAAYVPWHWNNMRRVYPPINDITTDVVNPPTYSAAVLATRAGEDSVPVTYDVKIAAQQKKAYPDIASAILPLASSAAFTKALEAAKAQGWNIVATDPASGTIEASQTSFWFGFTDDIVIRVTKDDEGSRVDIRSHSRHGRSDFGVNANRVRAYLTGLHAG
jgi:Protein of unknown function (DUF1499)